MATKPRPERMIFGYPGSKWRLAPQLVRLFPKHSVYVSPFGGSAAEFAWKEPSSREIFNDLDHNVYSVFAVLRNRRLCAELIRLLECSNDSRRLFYECFDKLRDRSIGLLDRAYCFLICGNIGFQGGHPAVNRSYTFGLNKKPRLFSLPDVVREWRDRMRLVEAENCDVFDLIDIYDSTDTFFFCDPPYHSATRTSGFYVHDTFDHRRFVKRLQALKGKALICGYPHRLYDNQLLGWRRIAFDASKAIGGPKPRTEMVWLNYDDKGKKLKQDLKLIRGLERLPA